MALLLVEQGLLLEQGARLKVRLSKTLTRQLAARKNSSSKRPQYKQQSKPPEGLQTVRVTRASGESQALAVTQG